MHLTRLTQACTVPFTMVERSWVRNLCQDDEPASSSPCLASCFPESPTLMLLALNKTVHQVPAYPSASFPSMQRMPVWWSWFSYINPFAWSIYGLVASQLGSDFTNVVNTYGFDPADGPLGQDLYVAQFIYKYYGYDADYLIRLIPIVLGFSVAFWLIASAGLKFIIYYSR